MQHIKNANARVSCGPQDLLHMDNAVIRFRNSPDAIPYLAPLGNEVVIRIDDKKCSDLLVNFIFSMLFLAAFSFVGISRDCGDSNWLATDFCRDLSHSPAQCPCNGEVFGSWL
jgi:hypothetical protein